MNERTILFEALEIADPAGRAAFLDEACGDDRELRQRVETLLRSHNDAGSFLEKTPAEIEELLPTQDSGEASSSHDDTWQELLDVSDRPDAIGRLGQYDVLELVGRGGMGVVLRAFDPKLNRVVAIKLLAPELAVQPVSVNRFLREARAAAAVSHDHVVSIYAIDDDARPPMIAMEMIDGQSLQQKIDSTGALDVKSILRIGMQTAAGLSAAHRQGLVHRDIKPANILLENGIEKVKLTDFGLARAVDDIGMTKTGQITGTPQYMSPEQAQGQRVDLRTDLFSLGCVLYAMCTGRAAFRADSAVAVLHRIVHDTPRPIREVNEDVPDWLCDIVEKLLEKNPDDRFDSATVVEERLGQCLAHLQQPDTVPLPESAGRIKRSAAPADEESAADTGTAMRSVRPAEVEPDTERRLHFVRNWLGIMGLLSLLWFFANLSMPYHGYVKFGFTMPTLLFSLLTGTLGLTGAWHAMNRGSYGWTLIGMLAVLLPVNGPQFLGLGITIWALTKLWNDDVRAAFSVSSTDLKTSRPLRMAVICLLMICVGFVISETAGGTHAVIRLIDNLNGQGRLALTSIRGHVKVRTSDGTVRDGRQSPQRMGTFDLPLYPGEYELQFINDKQAITETTTIEVIRGGHVGLYSGNKETVQIDIVGSGTIRSSDAIAPENLDPLLLLMLVVIGGLLLLSGRAASRMLRASPSGRPVESRHSSAWHLLRRVPIPAWVALLLFGLVWVAPLVELSGQDAISCRANGVLFYLLATAVLILWGGGVLLSRLVCGRWPAAFDVFPRPRTFVELFAGLLIATGVFVWFWADLGNERSRLETWSVLFGRGSITLELPGPDVELIYNGQRVVVPADGLVSLPVGFPGSYTYSVEHADGSQTGGEFIVTAGARIGSGALADAVGVVVTGPIRGRLEDRSVEDSGSDDQPAQQVARGNVVKDEATLIDDVREQIVSLLPEASGIPNSELLELASNLRGPDMDDVTGVPLSIILLLADPSLVPEAKREQAAGEFRYLTEGKPKPADIVRAVSLHQERGYATFLQPEYIKDVTVSVSENSANGTVTFEAPDLFAGKVHYVARRKNGEWRIEEFHLPAYQARIHRDDDGIWQSLRRAVGGDPE